MNLTKKPKLPKTWLTVNTWYTINLSPADQYQYYKEQNRYSKFRTKMYEAMLNIDHYSVIEISEPRGMKTAFSTGPRLHLHGIIRFENRKDLANFMLYRWNNLLKFTAVEIDTISDKQEWWTYVNKQHILPKNRILTNYVSKQIFYDTFIKETKPETEA